jgi:ATP-dependent protease ClpP protease subunit
MVRDVWGWLRARDSRPRPAVPTGHAELKIVAQDGGQSTDVYLYGEIGWFGVTAADVVNELLSIGTPKITVRINSEGGDVFDGVAIYNALVEHPAVVDVTVDGLAASMASLIAMVGETRTMKRGTQMMIHDAHAIVAGNQADMVAMGDLLGRICDEMAAIYADRAGGTPDAWRTVMRAEQWYTAGEAVTAGLATADAAADVPDDGPHLAPAAARSNLNLTSFLYAGRAAAPAPVPAAVPTSAVAAGQPTPPPLVPPPLGRGGLALI